jgi:succinylarginine dihydrolase
MPSIISVSEDELSLEVAIETYLFNSQLVALPDGETCLVAPGQCERNENVSVLIDRIVSDEGFDRVEFVDVRESNAERRRPGLSPLARRPD